jgi:uncharacterized membrane protein (GlpM family)
VRERAFIGYCRLARAAIVLVLLGLVLLLGTFYFVGPIFIGTGGSLQGLGAYLLASLAIWHPTLLFMFALWFLQRAAGCIAKEFDGRLLARHLGWAGWLLMLGALGDVSSRPLLLHSEAFARLLAAQDLRFPIWTATLFDTFVAAAVIGLVGLLLVLVGKVLRLQSAAAEELRQIF